MYRNNNHLIFNISKNDNYFLYTQFTKDFLNNNKYTDNQIKNIEYLIKK